MQQFLADGVVPKEELAEWMAGEGVERLVFSGLQRALTAGPGPRWVEALREPRPSSVGAARPVGHCCVFHGGVFHGAQVDISPLPLNSEPAMPMLDPAHACP